MKEYFAIVPGALLARTDLDIYTKLILVNILGRVNLDGYFSPSNVANETNIPISTVIRRFNKLQECGLLIFNGLKQQSKQRPFKSYTVNRDKLSDLTCQEVVRSCHRQVRTCQETAPTCQEVVRSCQETAISKIDKEDNKQYNKEEDKQGEIVAQSEDPMVQVLDDLFEGGNNDTLNNMKPQLDHFIGLYKQYNLIETRIKSPSTYQSLIDSFSSKCGIPNSDLKFAIMEAERTIKKQGPPAVPPIA